MKLYLSCWICGDQSISLTEAGIERRLTSFHFAQNVKKEYVDTYLKTGLLPWKLVQEKDKDHEGCADD